MAVPAFTTRTSFQLPDNTKIPFDTQGAVGPEHVMVVSQQAITAHNKTGTQIWGETLNALFALSGVFDPRIVFDPVAERFYLIAVRGKAVSSPTGSRLLIAVSKSSTPADATEWDTFSEEVSQSNKHFLDYPMIGYDADQVTIIGKLFPKDTETGPDDHTHVFGYLIPKADLLLATPTIANLQAIVVTDNDIWFPHPIVDVDPGARAHSAWRWTPIGGAVDGSLDRLDITAGSPDAVDLVEGFSPTETIEYTGARGLDGSQPSGATDLENHAVARIPAHPVKIGGFVYIALSGRDGTDGTIVVFKIDASDDTITAQTTLHESGLDLIYPALAVNASGHIVVGCTATGAAVLPGVMVFVGQDDGSTMTFAAGDTIKAGERVYDEDSGGRNRWGDYSAVEIDPTDNNRFWSFQSYGHNNTVDNTGRQIEVTEIITEPAGVFGILGLTIRRLRSVPGAVVPGRVALARGERRPTSWAAPDRKEKWTAARRREKYTAVDRN